MLHREVLRIQFQLQEKERTKQGKVVLSLWCFLQDFSNSSPFTTQEKIHKRVLDRALTSLCLNGAISVPPDHSIKCVTLPHSILPILPYIMLFIPLKGLRPFNILDYLLLCCLLSPIACKRSGQEYVFV